MSKTNIMKANTTIELKCDWNGDFTLIDVNGTLWFYPRKEWDKVQKHLWKLVKPAAGDPK